MDINQPFNQPQNKRLPLSITLNFECSLSDR